MKDLQYIQCCKCRKIKSVYYFHRNRTRTTGYNPRCKLCVKASKVIAERPKLINYTMPTPDQIVERYERILMHNPPTSKEYKLALKKLAVLQGRSKRV